MNPLVVEPLKVSPLIKLSRWAFLIAGIYHGIVKQKEYTIEAAKFRAEEEKRNLLRKEKLAREESLKNQETARDLAEALTGLRVRFEEVIPSENHDSTAKSETISKLQPESKSPETRDKSTSTDESILKNDSQSGKDSNSINDDPK